MSAKSERLLACLSDIGEEKIDEAAEFFRQRKRFVWQRWAALAAAVVLAVGAVRFLPYMGGMGGSTNAPSGGAAAPSGNTTAGGGGMSGGSEPGAGESDATRFMSYAGPILPLTLREEDGDIMAERTVALSFGEKGVRELPVTDAYLLSNSSSQDKTVPVLYPFAGSLYTLERVRPVLTAEGQSLETVLHAGGYTGGFQGVDGGGGEQLLNLDQIDSWEEYRALLSGGRYRDRTLEEYPDLSDIPVTVYRFFDAYGPQPDSRAGVPNPSIRAEFDLDYDKTIVLSCGFHAGRYDRENGRMIRGFSIPRPDLPWYGDPNYLIVIGDDIRNLTTGAYVTGGTDPDTRKLDNAGVRVERYTGDLESALETAAELMYRGYHLEPRFGEADWPDFQLYFGLLKEFLVSYGLLAEDGPERYGTGCLEDLDVLNVGRVFYLETELTIPAGGSAALTVELTKEGSYDFYPARAGNQGLYGYDLAAALGSNLAFTRQTAVLEGEVEIVHQSFGFAPEEGVTQTELSGEHFFLEVRERKNN